MPISCGFRSIEVHRRILAWSAPFFVQRVTYGFPRRSRLLNCIRQIYDASQTIGVLLAGQPSLEKALLRGRGERSLQTQAKESVAMDAMERIENTADTAAPVKVCLKRERWCETAIPTQERKYLLEEIKYWLAKSTTRQLIELLPEICKGADADIQTSPLYDLPREDFEDHVKCGGTGRLDALIAEELNKHVDADTTPEGLRCLQSDKVGLTGRAYVVVDGFTIDGENVGVSVKEKAIQA